MAMPFHNLIRSIQGTHTTPLCEQARIFAKTHCPAMVLILHPLHLFIHKMNNRLFCFRIYFCGIRVFEAEDMTREFHNGELCSVTNPEKRNAFFSRILNSQHFSFNVAFSNPARNNNAIHAFKKFG